MGPWIMIATDAIFGDPLSIPHPVIGIGKIITWWENRWYGERAQRVRGFFFLLSVLATTSFLAFLIHLSIREFSGGWILESILCGWFLATKSLVGVGAQMTRVFQKEGIRGARKKIGDFVSRDTDQLTESDILRATIETMAENVVDGVISPICFYYLGMMLGSPLVGIVFYKSINTLDSMVGYRNERYGRFGTASARLDDFANWLPARLSAGLILVAGGLSGGKFTRGWQIMVRDRHLHDSPNSAYAEASMAGVYGCKLGGPASYFGTREERPWIGQGLSDPSWDLLNRVTCNVWVTQLLLVGLVEGGRLIWG